MRKIVQIFVTFSETLNFTLQIIWEFSLIGQKMELTHHCAELVSTAHNWLSQSFSCDLAEKLPADRSFCQVANDMLATKTREATPCRSFMSRKNVTISLR